MQEEALGQVLGIFIAKTSVTGEMIEGIPIPGTEFRQRLFM
jgi:hypothetical protein